MCRFLGGAVLSSSSQLSINFFMGEFKTKLRLCWYGIRIIEVVFGYRQKVIEFIEGDANGNYRQSGSRSGNFKDKRQ